MRTQSETISTNPIAQSLKLPVGWRIVLFLLLILLSFASGAGKDLILRLLCTSLGTGLLGYSYLCSFSPVPLIAAVPGFLLSFLVTGSAVSACFSLVFFPCGMLLAFLLMRRASKTVTVLVLSISLGVLFLLGIAAELAVSGFDLRPDSFLAQYRSWFDAVGQQLIQAVEKNLALLGESAKSAYAGYVQTITQTLNLIKVVLPALFCAVMEGFGYLSVSVLQLAAKISRRDRIIPPGFLLILSPITAILFILTYLIGLFNSSETVSVFAGVAMNLNTLIAPGLFVLGIRSLVRRSRLASRRISFVVTVITLVLALFLSPYLCLLFIIVDGIGEIFFVYRMRKLARPDSPDT